jgi:hypothetical protein
LRRPTTVTTPRIRLNCEELESRIVPVQLKVISAPFFSAEPYSAVYSATSKLDNGALWSGSAMATLPPGTKPESSMIAPGSFTMSGQLVVKVLAEKEKGDIEGTDIVIKLRAEGELSWDNDPLSGWTEWSTSHGTFSAGLSGQGAWFDVSGGQPKPNEHSWTTGQAAGTGSAVITAKIGGTFSIDIDASGKSNGVWVGGSGDFHGEIGASLNVWMTYEPPPATVAVTAVHDDLGTKNDKEFGTYLAGVALSNTFTLTTGGSGITQVKLQIDGLPPNAGDNGKVKTLAAGTRSATFSIDTGLFTQSKLGGYKLLAVGLDAQGNEIAEFSGTVHVIDKLDLKLEVSPQIDAATLLQVGDVRLLAGIPLSLKFNATVSNLPLASAYKDKLDIVYRPVTSTAPVRLDVGSFAGGKVSFLRSSTLFGDVVATGADYQFYVAPKTPAAGVSFFANGQAQELTVLVPPEWLNKSVADRKYDLLTDDAAGLTSAYVIPVPVSLLERDLPQTAGTPFGIFDGLETFARLQVQLQAVIPLDENKTARVIPLDWSAGAKLLGQPLFGAGARLDKGKIKVQANLDGATLAFQSMTVSTERFNLLSVLGKTPLYTRSIPAQNWTVPIPTFLGPFQIVGKLQLSGHFEAEAKQFDVWAQVTVDENFSIVPAQSYFTLQMQGHAELKVKASGSVNVGVLGITPLFSLFGIDLSVPFVEGVLTGVASADLDAKLQIGLAGTLSSPQVTGLDKSNSHAKLAVGHDFEYHVRFLGGDGAPDDKPKKDAPPKKVVDLFGLGTGDSQGFSVQGAPMAFVAAAADVSTSQPPTVLGSGFGAVSPAVASATIPAAASAPAWTAVPAHVSNGRVTAVVVDPNNVDIVYVGTIGGVFRSRDGGANWTSLLAGPPIGALALVPAQGNQPAVLFVGTGEGNRTPDSLAGVGIYRISDAASDAPVVAGPFNLDDDGADVFTGRGITKLLVNPDDPNMVFVATTSAYSGISGAFVAVAADRGVYRSTNALSDAPAFTRLNVVPDETDTRISDMVFEPGNPDHLLVAVQAFTAYGDGGVYRSTDATGASPSFTRTLALDDGVSVKLAIAKVGDVLTVLAATSEGSPQGRLRQSTDGGATWPTVLAAADGFAGATGASALAVAINPSNPNIIYLGGALSGASGSGHILLKSTDGGTSFVDVAAGLQPLTHVIALAPSDPSIIYTGNDSGVWRSLNAAFTWDNLNSASLTIHNASRPAASARGPGRPAPLYFGDDRLFRSTDGGATRKLISQAPLARDLAGAALPITSIAVSAQDDRVRLVALGQDQFAHRGKIFATTTGAAVLRDITGALPLAPISQVVIDPFDKNVVYVVLGGSGLANGWHVWKTNNLADLVNSSSPNAASQWQPVGAGIPDVSVNALLVDPGDANVLYASTDAGVYRSLDRGGSWTLLGAGLPQTAVFGLTIQAPRLLIATTHGLGQYQLQLDTPPPPQFTSPASAGFVLGKRGVFAVTAAGAAPISLSVSGKLPAGLSFKANKNGVGVLSGKATVKTPAIFIIKLVARTPSAAVVQRLRLAIGRPPKFTSLASSIFTARSAGDFTVLTSGFPAAALSVQGALPSGVVFQNLGKGRARLTGTPAPGTGGVHHLLIQATNGVGASVTQSFRLTVKEAPVFTSPASAEFVTAAAGAFTVTTRGFPDARLSVAGNLPAGLTFVDNADGTATLAGTPGPQNTEFHKITVTASSGAATAKQVLTIVVNPLPPPLLITGPLSTTFIAGSAGTVKITSLGDPPALSASGALPDGVTFVDNGDGTATLAGVASTGTAGVYPLLIHAVNGSNTITRGFRLTVGAAPAFISPGHVQFTVGSGGTFAVAVTGTPAPILSMNLSHLPSGISFDEDTGILSGVPEPGTGGEYLLNFYATNAMGSDAQQAFTLKVHQPLTFTSVDHATMVTGNSAGLLIQAVSDVVPTFSLSGELPAGVQFVDDGRGYAVLTGSPEPGAVGEYVVIITAHDGIDPDVDQVFTLSVKDLGFVSADETEFTPGQSHSFTLQAQVIPDAPTPVISLDPSSASLPAGLTLVANDDGTAFLSGTPEPGSGGIYQFVFRAQSGSNVDTQVFTLLISERPEFTSAAQATFTVGSAGSFQVTTRGFPAATLSVADPLPAGLTLIDQGDGTAILSGTPAAGTGGNYWIVLIAENVNPYWGKSKIFQSFNVDVVA